MKKLICVLLTAVLLLSCSFTAFAAISVTKSVSDGESTAALPLVVNDPAAEELPAPGDDADAEEPAAAAEEPDVAVVEVVDADGNEAPVPVEDILIMLPVDQAQKQLEGEKLELLEACLKAAKEEKEYVVTNFFWLDVAPEYAEAVAGGSRVKVTFAVPGLSAGDLVKILVNGVEVPAENIIVNEDGTVTVYFYEFGAVTIMTKAAE